MSPTPWHIEHRDDKWCVIKETDGSTEKCHETREQATRHMAALYASEPENRATSFSTEPWDGSAGRWPDAASYCRSSLVDNNRAGSEKTKSECHFPVKAPGSNAYNVNALRAVVGGRGAQANFPGAEAARATARRLLAQYNSSTENRAPLGPIESRAASVVGTDAPQRVIEVLAVPYEQEAIVEYRGEVWRESFERGAFDGIETRPVEKKVKVFRDHAAGTHLRGTSTSGLVGLVQSFDSQHSDGLLGQVKIAKTDLGEETLELARLGVLGVSVGFGVRGSDQILNRADRTRRIQRAFVDHLAFPDNGAYESARVIDVRADHRLAKDLPKLETPRLDEVVAWMESRRR